MDLTHVITNTAAFPSGFQQLSTWPYATSAATYFWAGFTIVFAFGLVALGYKWLVGKVIAGGAQ